MPDESVQCCVTSPPYFGLRDYGIDGQIGLERSPDEFVARLVGVFREVRRVLRSDGTLWLVVGDSYAVNGGARSYGSTDAAVGRGDAPDEARRAPQGYKPKDLLGIPWLLAFALRADGWYLRSDVIWAKPNPMPESVTDRPTSAHEHVFLLAKSARYFYDADAIREEASDTTHGNRVNYPLTNGDLMRAPIPPSGKSTLRVGAEIAPGRNKRNVWEVATQPFSWRQNARQVRVEPDDADDDTTRITSRDCPVHGDRRPQSTARDGGRVDGEASRTERTDARLAQESLDVPASTGQNLEPSSAGESSDSPSHERAPAATPRSTQSRRTDLDPATNPSCMPSDERLGRTDDTSTPPESAAQRGSTDASSSAPDGSDDHPSVQTTGGKSRTSSCTCRFYRLEETDHFATFPPKLIEPCILAGSAEGDVILDPFAGAGTTGLVALRHDRSFVGIELNSSYAEMARERIRQDAPLLNTPAELAA